MSDNRQPNKNIVSTICEFSQFLLAHDSMPIIVLEGLTCHKVDLWWVVDKVYTCCSCGKKNETSKPKC